MTAGRKPGRPRKEPVKPLPVVPPPLEAANPQEPAEAPDGLPIVQGFGPIALSIGDVIKMTALARASLYRDIKSGQLPARRSGNRTIVLVADLKRYIANLPSAEHHFSKAS